MKSKILSTIFLFSYILLTIAGYSQGAAINITGTTADQSAMLDVSSNNSGFLLPRLTTVERDAITNPASGLQIYNTTSKCFEFFEDGNWQPKNCSFACGIDNYIDRRDGNIYKTVLIGNQCWMKENLRYIPVVSPTGAGSSNIPYYYVYGYDGTEILTAKSHSNYESYGVLYNWPAAMNGSASSNSNPSGVQGACPAGWHLPGDAEWQQLEMYLGMSSLDANSEGLRGTNEGGKIKFTGTTYWGSPNTGATNSSGFSGFAGGFRDASGGFANLGTYSFIWVASEFSNDYAWYRILNYNNSQISRNYCLKSYGFTIRCVKN